MPFYCSICETESTQICAYCTKDTCANHICAKCHRCSDCCTCEVALDEPEFPVPHTELVRKPEPVEDDEEEEEDFEEDEDEPEGVNPVESL